MRPFIFIPAFLLLITGAEASIEPTIVWPIISKVIITSPEGTELNPIDPIILSPGEKYIFTAKILSGPESEEKNSSTSLVPDDWTLSWCANPGAFESEPQIGNEIVWTAPTDNGDVIFQVNLDNNGDETQSFKKTFRVFVGEIVYWPHYARHIALVNFQDWCDDESVEAWAAKYPGAGVDRLISSRLNIWRINLDEEVNEHDAIREITWWPSVISAEIDAVIQLDMPIDGVPLQKESFEAPVIPND
ncbi:MAG: hypothetical protein ABIC40_08260 [bacterium]